MPASATARDQTGTAALYGCMRRVLATERGGDLYRRHYAMIEPIFGHTNFNRRIERVAARRAH